jgi:hypothetical protein
MGLSRGRRPWVRRTCSPTALKAGSGSWTRPPASIFVIEVIKRGDDQKGFQALPHWWVVERTFGWMTRWRRRARIADNCQPALWVVDPMPATAMGGNDCSRGRLTVAKLASWFASEAPGGRQRQREPRLVEEIGTWAFAAGERIYSAGDPPRGLWAVLEARFS